MRSSCFHKRFHSTVSFELSSKRAVRVTLIGLAGNVGLSVSKGVAGVMFNSAGLIADAAHSISDLFSDGITLAAVKVARKPPSQAFPYGYGKIETLGSLSVGSLLIMGSLGIGYHSLGLMEQVMALSQDTVVQTQMIHPSALYVAGASIAVKELLFQLTIKEADALRSPVLVANAWHHRSDAMSSFVALGGILGSSMGYPVADPVGGMLVAGMILQSGVSISWNAVRELLDANVDKDVSDKVAAMVRDLSSTSKLEIEDLIQVRSRKMGHYTIVDMFVSVNPKLSISAAHLISEHIRVRILDLLEHVTEVMVHVVPRQHGEKVKEVSELDRSHSEIEFDVREKLKSMEDVMKVSHVTVHFIDGRCLVQAEVLVQLDQTVREARQVAVRARDVILELKDVDDVDVHLELDSDPH